MTQWSTIFRYGSDSDVEASSGRGSLYPHKRTSTACRIIKPEIVAACTAAARRTHRGAAMPKAGRTGPIERRDQRPACRGGGASQHRGVEGCRLDFAASIAEENPQRGLGGGCWELAYVRRRNAANVAFGRWRNRRWMSNNGHRSLWRLRRNRFRNHEDRRP